MPLSRSRFLRRRVFIARRRRHPHLRRQAAPAGPRLHSERVSGGTTAMAKERRERRLRLAVVAIEAGLLALAPFAALAGPPFMTDDPEPVDYQHYEFYTFTQG